MPKIQHVGMHAKRMDYPCHSSDRERAFADRWRHENKKSAHVLTHLLNPRIVKNSLGWDVQVIDHYPTQEEATLAATVIQWLGTHVGFDFVRLALKDCGYRLVNERDGNRLHADWADRAIAAAKVTHGLNCPKQPHTRPDGYLHAENDDRPYDVDGCRYCGRCHRAL